MKKTDSTDQYIFYQFQARKQKEVDGFLWTLWIFNDELSNCAAIKAYEYV